ncbi:LAQU0S14e02410g1_1 [Lachancea quebecensis]|uniref:LAQU0S14e02410g1_1 n=1 Tax=Lachancea quebecensis TaxID=1654605 RepID=A0A0P1KVJ2_9SACH|nr:LAQU0S14e02410g1_1 [Lachancea quebecensis]
MSEGGANIFDMLAEGGGSAGSGAGGGFDAMLEILPEEIDVGFVEGFSNEAREVSAGPGRATGGGAAHVETLFEATPPIDVADQQNGEIAQLWDFNVDEFMMTPSGSSDSATISAPNSFNSEHPGQMGGYGAGGAGGAFAGAFGAGAPAAAHNWGHLLGAPFHSESGSQQLLFASPGALLGEDAPGGASAAAFRPTLPTRRSSSQLNKAAMADDGGLPLAHSTTANSVRKNSVTRPLSSSSLSSYRQNSVPELPKKPQVQCFNCKTFKTPLWRRDAQGNTMCNACGLFQKLHGTMRPLSLKSDVIRKRNTKKRGKKADTVKDKEKDPSFTVATATAAARPARGKQDSSSSIPQTSLPSTPVVVGQPHPNGSGTAFPSTLSKSRTSSSTNLSVNGTFTSSSSSSTTTQLSSNVLMNHNHRMLPTSGMGVSKKSRRSSSSSSTSNSSNRSSSSRSMVPILPKPSPGGTSSARNQFQLAGFPGSAGNSTASSPRFSNSPRPTSATSPLPTSAGQTLSSSTGRPSMAIGRRKSSRQAHASSSSSSFVAASLQQHHQQQQPQSQPQSQQMQQAGFQSNTAGSSSSTISAQSNSWNSNTIAAPSPKSGRSPRSPFDLFSSSSSSQEPHSRPASRKPHTSLLSQQLQQATTSPQHPQSPSQFQTPAAFQNSSLSSSVTPQPASLKRSPMTASPRNSYMDSIQQQRGLHSDTGVRRTTSLRAEANNVTGIAANAPSSQRQKDTFMDDLEWLKFGL